MINYATHGERKTNEEQQKRKFVTQMSSNEVTLCATLVKQAFQNKGITPSYHLIKNQTKYSMSNICQTIMSSDLPKYIKEYNEREVIDKHSGKTKYNQRVMFYVPFEVSFKCTNSEEIQKGYLSVVYEISTGKITTAYYNEVEDSLRLPNLEYYTQNLEVRHYRLNGYTTPNKVWFH